MYQFIEKCFIDCAYEAHWERSILAPLLSASGYEVSFESDDRDKAAIVLSRDVGSPANETNDSRVLRLRDTTHISGDSSPSVYRYDRVGLISAIEAKLAGGV